VSEVVEFTLRVKPGHYDQVVEIYSDFAHDYMAINPSLKTVLIVGDAGQARFEVSVFMRQQPMQPPSTATPSSPTSTTQWRP
jgi:hypothetical protein